MQCMQLQHRAVQLIEIQFSISASNDYENTVIILL